MSRAARGSETPLSLFSFQDLITSLSGILILLVLFMAVEVSLTGVAHVSAQSHDEATAQHDLIEAVRVENVALKQRLEGLRTNLASQAAQDTVDLVRDITIAEREQATLLQERAEWERQRAAQAANLQEAKERMPVVKSKIAALDTQVQTLRSALKKAVDDKRVFFIPEDGVSKTPIIVECSRTSVRVGFVTRNDPVKGWAAESDGVEGFAQYLQRFSPEREYVVLIMRPSGVDTCNMFREAAVNLGFDVGLDAIEEGSSVGFGGSGR